MMHDHTIDHAPVGAITHYWVRPTFKQFLNLNPVARRHVLDGGLMLEEEL